MKPAKYTFVVLLLVCIVTIAYIGDRSTEQSSLWWQPSAPVTLYFGAGDATGVQPVVRWMSASKTDIIGRVQALIDGPTDTHVYRSIPEMTTIRSARLVGDRAIIDFDRAIIDNHPGGSAGEMITVYSIVNTVTEIDGVREVVFLIDGRGVETLVGHMDLRYPIERDETVIVID